VAAPGTQALIHLLPRLLPRQSVAVLAPTYAEHAAAWALAGHAVTDAATLEQALSATVVVVVRPNNPDGQVLGATALLRLASQLAARRGLLVVDEAFADLEGCSLAPALPHPGLLLLRSFGKTYGLAGVRLGFALGGPALAAALRDALGPWAVSGPALHAGIQALSDESWRQAAATRLASDAARLDACLHQAGCRISGGTRLFRLADHADAAGLADRLAQAGILVRQFAGNTGVLRFGLPALEPDWTRLHDALRAAGDCRRM
jgi:cobalamin biosynthetic protein CobC